MFQLTKTVRDKYDQEVTINYWLVDRLENFSKLSETAEIILLGYITDDFSAFPLAPVSFRFIVNEDKITDMTAGTTADLGEYPFTSDDPWEDAETSIQLLNNWQ